MSFQPLGPENPLPWLRRGAAVQESTAPANGRSQSEAPAEPAMEEPPPIDDSLVDPDVPVSEDDGTYEEPAADEQPLTVAESGLDDSLVDADIPLSEDDGTYEEPAADEQPLTVAESGLDDSLVDPDIPVSEDDGTYEEPAADEQPLTVAESGLNEPVVGPDSTAAETEETPDGQPANPAGTAPADDLFSDLRHSEGVPPQLPGFGGLPQAAQKLEIEPVDPGLLSFQTTPAPEEIRLDETAELPRAEATTRAPAHEPDDAETTELSLPGAPETTGEPPQPGPIPSLWAEDEAPAAFMPAGDEQSAPEAASEIATPATPDAITDDPTSSLAEDRTPSLPPDASSTAEANLESPMALTSPADDDDTEELPVPESGQSAPDPAPPAPASITSTSARLKLSEILREAELQGSPVASMRVFQNSEADTPASGPAAAAPPPVPTLLSEDEYPSLLVRPRDRTEPFLDMMPVAMADDVDQRFKDLERLPSARDPLTEMGAADYVEPPPARERRFQADAAGQVPWKILAIVLFALSLGAFIFALTGWTVTAEDEATDVNRRIAAELTEIDRYVATNQAAIREAEPADNGRVTLPDFPIAITLSENEARELEGDELRDVILDRAAARTYQDGVEVYGSSAGLFDDLSTPGLVRFGIEVMRDDMHSRLFLLTAVLAVLTAALAGVIVLVTRRGGRITALGIGVIAGGVVSLLGSVLMRLLFDRATSSQDDVLADGLGAITDDVTYLFLRNSLVFVVIGVIIVAIGIATSMLDRRQSDELDHIATEQPTLVSG